MLIYTEGENDNKKAFNDTKNTHKRIWIFIIVCFVFIAAIFIAAILYKNLNEQHNILEKDNNNFIQHNMEEELNKQHQRTYVENGKLTSTTGELAGSSLDMATAVKNTHLGLKIPLDESLRMASLYPAQYLYENKERVRGQLSIGMQADMLVLTDDLSVGETWISGEKFN